MSFLRKGLYLVLFTLFANLFLSHPFGSVAFVFSTIGFFIFLIALACDQEEFFTYKQSLLSSGFFLFLFSFILLNRTNPTVVFLSQVGIVGINILFLYLISTRIPFVRSLYELFWVPILTIFTYLTGAVRVFFEILKVRIPFPRFKISLNPGPVVMGLLLGIPTAGILLAILVSADPIFATAIKHILELRFLQFKLPHIPIRLTYSLIVFILITPIVFMRRKHEFKGFLKFERKHEFVSEMTIITGLVAMVIGFFLLVQWKYVFINVPFETDLSQFGVATYSEYVKRGFNELLVASLFIYSVLWGGLMILRNRDENQRTLLLYLQGIVIGEFLVFLFSLFRRVFLYQEYHGLTLGRVYGSFFLGWITLITLILLGRHIWKKHWVTFEVATTIGMILLFGFFNAESYIARLDPPTVNKRIDYVYLSRMSADGHEGWVTSYQWAADTLAQMNSKDEFSRNERRDIAYAGMIVQQLMSNYDWVVRHYGSDDAFETYFQTLTNHEQAKIEQHFVRNQEQFASISGERRKVIEKYIDQVISDRVYLGSFKEETASEIAYGSLILGRKLLEYGETLKLEEKQKQVKFPPFHFTLNLANICDFMDEAFYLNGFTNAQIERDCGFSFYQFPVSNQQFGRPHRPGVVIIKDDWLDRLLSWNQQGSSVYTSLEEQKMFERLLDLQDQYFALRRKMLKQPPEEWDFDIDVSFQAPFLTRY